MNLIRCALCDKPVDEQTVERDDARRGWCFTVKCHGAEDQCFVDYEFVASAGCDLDQMEASAFTVRKIEARV